MGGRAEIENNKPPALNAKTKFGFKKGHVQRAAHPNFAVYDFFVQSIYDVMCMRLHARTCVCVAGAAGCSVLENRGPEAVD